MSGSRKDWDSEAGLLPPIALRRRTEIHGWFLRSEIKGRRRAIHFLVGWYGCLTSPSGGRRFRSSKEEMDEGDLE